MWFKCSVFPFEHWILLPQSVCGLFRLFLSLLAHFSILFIIWRTTENKQTDTTICHFNIRWENLRSTCIRPAAFIHSFIHTIAIVLYVSIWDSFCLFWPLFRNGQRFTERNDIVNWKIKAFIKSGLHVSCFHLPVSDLRTVLVHTYMCFYCVEYLFVRFIIIIEIMTKNKIIIITVLMAQVQVESL